MRVAVIIKPKKEVLDTQGRAVQESLNEAGLELKNCIVGRYVELELDCNQKQEALQQAQKITEKLLCNKLIENYQLEVVDE